MKSIADDLACEVLEATLRLTPSERVELALRLGGQAVDTYASAHQVSTDEARRILRRGKQVGRRFSAAASDGE
ncbi:MAG: hypothetical protein ABR587_12975 [Candidatus Binatia bacterium]